MDDLCAVFTYHLVSHVPYVAPVNIHGNQTEEIHGYSDCTKHRRDQEGDVSNNNNDEILMYHPCHFNSIAFIDMHVIALMPHSHQFAYAKRHCT